MPLINCRIQLKLKWTKYCVLCVAGNENNINEDINANNMIFTIKDLKLYIHVVTLSAKDNQKLSKLLSKWFERSVCWNEYKTESDNKNTTYEFTCFLKLNFVGVNRLFILVDSNHDNNTKTFKAKRYYLPKGIIKNYNVISNRKNFYDQAMYSNIKQYEEIRTLTLTTGQGEDCTTGCLLDYDYIKSHYRLIAVDLSRQKELNSDPKAI